MFACAQGFDFRVGCLKFKSLEFKVYFIFFVHYLQIIVTTLRYITRTKNISKINYTSSEKKNVRGDQNSLSFRVGHCHRQLIGINTSIYYNHLQEQSLLSQAQTGMRYIGCIKINTLLH